MNADARDLAAGFDIEKLTPEFYADPYPTYRALREHEPVKRMPNGSWFLTRYDDLVSAYKSTKLFLLRQEEGVFPEIRRFAALRAPHHQPRLQRPARAHEGTAADHGRAVAARHRRDGARPDRAGGPADRRARSQRQRRSDRRFRRRDPDRGDRQSAGCAAGGARPLARLVAGDPGRARAGDRPGSFCPRQQGGEGFSRLSGNPGGATTAQAGQPRTRRADPPHSGRGQWRTADREGTAAQLHLPAQCRA